MFTEKTFQSFLFWLGVVCMGWAWTCWSGVYVSTYKLVTYETWFSYVLAAAGATFLILSLRRVQVTISWDYLWILVPVVLYGVTIPFPYSLGPWVLVSGLALFFFGRNNAMVRSMAPGVLISGLLLTVESLLVPLWYYLGCHDRGLSWLASLAAKVFAFLGTTCSVNGHTLIAKYTGDYRIIQVTADALGLLPGLFIFIGVTLSWLLMDQHKPWKGWLSILFLWACYLLARYMVLLWVFLGWADKATITMMWNPLYGVLSFVPMAVVLALSTKGVSWSGQVRLSWAGFSKGVLGWTILACVAIMAGVAGSSLTDLGTKKGGRVLIDESHSEWEDTMRAFDTKWYGMAATYNYYCLRTFLEHYYHVKVNTEDITSDVLATHDVVILKCPTRMYARKELEALETFVQGGGGLFLIGDHTDVFGTSTNLNHLAKRFGLSFDKNGQWDIYGQFSVYRQPRTLGHPVGKQTPEFLFATGCTLSARVWHEKPIIGYGMMTRRGDYKNKHFFPDEAHYEDREFGLFLQLAGAFQGKGRVLCFTDSTVWSNFSMFYQGKPELLLESLMWLNRSNTWWAHVKPRVLLLSALLAMAAVFLSPSRVELRRHHSIIVACLMMTVVVSSRSVDLAHEWAYKQPEALRDFQKITFDCEHSDIFLENRFWFPEKIDTHTLHYSAFFVSAQRLGIVPQVRDSFFDTLQKDKDPVVIVNPYKRFSEKEVAVFHNFVSQGGKALILDSSERAEDSFAWQLLEPWAIEIVYGNAGGESDAYQATYLFSEEKNSARSVAFPARDICQVKGGQPRLWYVRAQDRGHTHEEEWAPCLTEVSAGKGKVWACTLSQEFSGLGLGNPSAIPNRHQQNRYRLVFKILKALVGD
ncbi:MAG: hypothetical protein SWE60_17430 [Thermodesulfobacteriota bacterium]|nr:hypothetical protein [Thermodesulfobacteriota bacterium]